jgi:hypothetical protein
MKKSKQQAPFFGLQDRMPVFLALLLGFQHSLAMYVHSRAGFSIQNGFEGPKAWFSLKFLFRVNTALRLSDLVRDSGKFCMNPAMLTLSSRLAGIIAPPMIIAGAAAFDQQTTQYLVSTSLIVCGILSSVQITRFHIYKTPYYVGTGLISVVGTSFSMIPIATKGLAQMYANGKCPSAADGTPLPCPAGYGALLGTASLCSLLEIGLSFMTPKTLKKLFPPIVTGKRLYLSLPLASLLAPRDLFEKEADRLTSRPNRDAHWGGLGPDRFSGLGRGLRILHGPTYKW